MTSNHNSVDSLIKIAINNKNFNAEYKSMALNVIASKAGIHFHKGILKQHVSLNYYPKVVEICTDLRESTSNYFVLKGNLLVYEKTENKMKASIRSSLREFKNPYY